MAVLYSAATITPISEYVDVLSTDLKRLRYSDSEIFGDSQLNLTERPSREHYIIGAGSLPVATKSTIKGTPKRLRRSTSEIQSNYKIDISSCLVLPVPFEPKGRLILDGLDLHNQRLKSGLIHNLIFEVRGSKIAGMQLEFEVKSLDGTRKVYKTLTGSPGGIYEESITELESEKIQIGTIPILKNEIKIESGEQEFAYTLIQSNNFINLRFELVSGLFMVY